ncbi:MAG: hypothetical protein SVW02_00705 [Candidatus Nanohaloarchaea archaeon]|nr:hypothetical protein [Candidatus Nanohaloarchaea archaeon]
MADGERRYSRKVPEYLQYLLELSWMAQHRMHRAKREMKRPDFSDERYRKAVQGFKELLEELYFAYEPKFDHSSEVSVGKEITQKLDEEGKDVADLSFDECEQLMRSIRDLQEHLGHTSFESQVHSEEGVGL